MSLVRRGAPPALVKTEDRSLGATTEQERRYAAIYERLFASLCDYASRVMDRADAEDLVQDTLYRIWDKWPVIASDNPGPMYFFRAVRNAALNATTRGADSRPSVRVLDVRIVDPGGSADARVEAEEHARALDAVVATMPARCREAWILIRENSCSYEQAAEIMDVDPKTARNHLVRANHYVREALTDAGYLEAARKRKSLPSSTEGNQS